MMLFFRRFLFLFLILFGIFRFSEAMLVENDGIIEIFPSVPQKSLKLGLMDIGFSYKFYSLGVDTKIKWPQYIIGIYNAEIKLVQEIELFSDRITMFGASLEGVIDESDKVLRAYSISNFRVNPPISTVFLSLAQEIVPYNVFVLGFTFKISSGSEANERFVGGFVYSEFLSLGEKFYLPIYFEFLTKLDSQDSRILFYSNFVHSPMYSIGMTISLWDSLLNLQLGVIYPGTSFEVKEFKISLPVIPYLNIYFLL